MLTRVILALLTITALFSATNARACLFQTSNYCVKCGTLPAVKEADFCPGGDAGLTILKGLNQGCAVQFFDASVCGSGVPSRGAGGIGPYDLNSPDDQVVAFASTGSRNTDLLAYRPGKGAAAVIRVSRTNTLLPTGFNRPDTGNRPFGIGSFDLRDPRDRVVPISGRLLLAFRPGSGESAVVRFEGNHFDSLLSGSGVGGFDLRDPRDQVIALASNLLFAYRPGSGESAVVSFDGIFHSLLQTRGIGAFDLKDSRDRVVALGDRLALAYRTGEGKRSWAVVRFETAPTPHFETLETKSNEGIGSFDLRGDADTIVTLSNGHRVVAFRPGGGESAVVTFSTTDLKWHTLFTGHGLGAFALNDPNDRAAVIASNLLLAYRPGKGAATLVRFRFDGTNGIFDTLFDRPDAPAR